MLTRAQGGVTLGLEQGELKADFSHLGERPQITCVQLSDNMLLENIEYENEARFVS
jgi:hypothetical protein